MTTFEKLAEKIENDLGLKITNLKIQKAGALIAAEIDRLNNI